MEKENQIPDMVDFIRHMFEGLLPGSTDKQFYTHRLLMQYSTRLTGKRLPEKQFIAEERKQTTKFLRLLPSPESDLRSKVRSYRQYLDLHLADLNKAESEKMKQPKLTVDEVALKCHYERIIIKRGSIAEGIAKKFGHRSGDNLYNKFTDWSKKANRTGDPGNVTKLNRTIQHIEKVIQTLPRDKRQEAQDDLNSLIAIQEGNKK